ncbi:hypothetical protein [Streptomyces sp. BE20]|nr:hypothetical protein [Streptomyces sp. BE20]
MQTAIGVDLVHAVAEVHHRGGEPGVPRRDPAHRGGDGELRLRWR